MSGFKFETRTCGRCGQEWEALSFWGSDAVCGDCGTKDYNARLAALREGRPYTIDSIGGACPTQAFGQAADGRFYYFRARHGDWTLETGATEDEAVCGDLIAKGDDPSGGYVEWEEVTAILDEHFGVTS